MTASSGGARRIAVCIDDFGLHDGINGAALSMAESGRLHAISCMVGAPRWREGAAELARLPQGSVDLGVHLDLTEHPIAASLLDRAKLKGEINAQLDAFEKGVGRAPDHIDGHQHVHQFPVVRDALMDVLVSRYPSRRPWLRRTMRPAALPSAGIKPWVIERLGCNALSARCTAGKFGQNRHLLGVYATRIAMPGCSPSGWAPRRTATC